MFTSRSEYRLSLAFRQRGRAPDGAREPRSVWSVQRGQALCGARGRRWAISRAPLDHPARCRRPRQRRHGLEVNQDGVRRTAFDLLSFAGYARSRIFTRIWPELAAVPAWAADRVANDARYSVYLERQAADIDAFRRDECLTLPSRARLSGRAGLLRGTARPSCESIRPRTIGQAGRIEGMTPAALTVLASFGRPGTARRDRLDEAIAP